MQIDGLIPAPQLDLVDFGISDNKIWGLWCNSEGETSISTYLINFNATKCWLACSLEPINEKTISALDSGVDPKHIYCSNIFYPGRFQVSTILKALMVSFVTI
jgi:Nucleoporin Nup120/160